MTFNYIQWDWFNCAKVLMNLPFKIYNETLLYLILKIHVSILKTSYTKNFNDILNGYIEIDVIKV